MASIFAYGGHLTTDKPSKLMFVSSHRSGSGFETLDTGNFYQRYPYSLGAIGYYLEQLGWETKRIGMSGSRNPIRLAHLIDEFQPDIIYTYGSLTALNPLLSRRMFCRYRDFLVVHGWDDVYSDIWLDTYGWLPSKIMVGVERLIVTRSDAVVTLSRYNQLRARRWGRECHYIPNGANMPEFEPKACTIKLEGRVNLVYTGDQAPWKRTDEICAAMRHVPSDIKLYLTGPRYAYLDKYASENCIFLGYVSKNDQLSVMSQADVFVVTADQDCNAKLQEYLRFRKPILGYDGRANLFFTNEHNALLTCDYPVAIIRLANDPGLRNQLAENAARDLPILSWPEVATEFDTYFKTIFSQAKQSR